MFRKSDSVAKTQSACYIRGNDSRILSFKTGSIADEYELGKKLGEGHFGSTFKCLQKSTGKEFAIKRISKARLIMLGTPLEEVKREIGIMYHLLGHPNIVAVESVFEDQRSISIVMELCTGGELYDRIISKGFHSEREAARLMQTIIAVVDYCHSLGVVHRDLKPENFLFADPSEESPLKAIDFGLSIFFTRGVPINAGLAGSPLYLAPEMVFSNGENYGPEVDIWSAGVILYMLLSGFCPFPTDLPTMDDLFHSILHDAIDYDSEPWPDISEDAKSLTRGMLRRDPKKRLTASQVLNHPWIAQTGVAPDTPFDPTVLSRLRRYSTMTHIRKLATRVIAAQLSEEEILGMKELFRQLDTDNNGSISFEELKEGIGRMGMNVGEFELQSIYSGVDVDKDNSIDRSEFFAATLSAHRLMREESILSAFQYFDRDRSGSITVEELNQVCRDFHLNNVNVAEMMAEVDVDGNGSIDYNEFAAMMHRHNVIDSNRARSLGKDKQLLKTISQNVEKMKRVPTL